MDFFRTMMSAYPASEQEVSVVLIQDGVAVRDVPASRVYVLSDDAASRNITPSFPAISCAEMLRMIFEADSVIALS